MKLFTKIVLILTLVFVYTNVNAQFKDFGIKGGFQFNGVIPATEFEGVNGYALSSYMIRGYLRFELSDYFNGEAGVGYAKFTGDDINNSTYESTGIPIDLRLLWTPFNLESVNPYLYAGTGLLHITVDKYPVSVSPQGTGGNAWFVHWPFGLGTEVKLSDALLLDLQVGADYTWTESINGYMNQDNNDWFFNMGIGLTFAGEGCNSDKDNDGLTRCEEEELGTDPRNPDTDGDGLNDGAEVKQYYTDPKNPDTDGDGLKDGEEVMKYKTNPLKADTDNDGLNDYEEVMTYKTDPLKADTDGDGLNDGEEVLKYKTSPFNADTDSDGLKDGEEVMKYKTDPLKADTDGGTVNDGIEVNRGTNPLDPKDDVPAVTVEKQITFDNVGFVINRAELSKTAKTNLDGVYDAFSKLNDAKLDLGGHTCSLGSEDYNMKLSLKRVNAVKEYLVNKGINADVINTEAFGELKPAFPNDNEKDRSKNRRTEIKTVYMEKQ